MASNKLLRTNEDIKFVLSRLLPQVKDPRVGQGKMLSITRVDTTGDLRYSKVYVSALGELDEKEFRRGIRSAAPWLRRELGSALSLRYTPELIFELDHSIEHGAYINSLIEKLELSGEEETDHADD
ncbi:MAG: 30S ribosome-binding factor RbfA [Oscillospiraceae bacterium]|nr:30S ribosome-binding factor RbfA [Oscillospiraceae bacterium]